MTSKLLEDDIKEAIRYRQRVLKILYGELSKESVGGIRKRIKELREELEELEEDSE